MAGKSGQGRGPRARERAQAVVIPLPGVRARTRPAASRRPGALRSAARFAPSGRSFAVAVGLLALGVGGYFVARDTSLFAVTRIEVIGVPPDVAAAVEATARPLLRASLVGLDGHALEARLGALPTVVAARYDRAFPHTLRIVVTPERPVAVLRQASRGWLVSARGRILREVPAHSLRGVPRIWIPASVDVAPGLTLTDADGGRAARSLAPLAAARLGLHVRFVRSTDRELTWVLATGKEIRLGDDGDLPLKLAVVAKILSTLAGDEYVDVSVPERPVAGPIVTPAPAQPTTSDGSLTASASPQPTTAAAPTTPSTDGLQPSSPTGG